MKVIVSIISFFILLTNIIPSQAQTKVEGIVFDVDTKQRVGRVMLTNLRTGAKLFNNTRGEFVLNLEIGDKLVSSKENYHSDTLEYTGQVVLVINLKKKTIYIDPVTVVARKTPDQILAERREEYDKAFKLADPGDYVSVGQNGAGLSINAVYNYFSREGRNARRLTRYFQREYEENIVDIRFSRDLVRNTIGLEGDALDNFMIRYRPSYDFVMAASPYQMINYIKSKYEFFKFAPYIKPLPDLNKLEIDQKE